MPARGAIGATSRVDSRVGAGGAKRKHGDALAVAARRADLELAVRSRRRTEGDALDVLADLEIERHLPDVDRDPAGAAERRRSEDPARVEDVGQEHRARACSRIIVLERQADLLRAGLQTLVAPAADRARVDALIQLSRQRAVAGEARRAEPRRKVERQRLRIRPRRLGRGATVQRVPDRQPRLVRQGDRRLVRGGREGDRRSHRERAGRGGQAERPHPLDLGHEPVDETGEVRAVRPADLGHRARPREAVPRRALFGADMLGPQIPLQPEDMLALARSQLRRQRVEGVDALQIDEVAAARRLELAEPLAVVEIEGGRGAQHQIVPRLGGGDRAAGALPRHDRRSGRNPALQDFVPADHPPSVRGEECADARHEPALQRMLVLDPERLHPRLDLRAGVPLVLDRFVAADVDEARREHGHHLAQHILEEAESVVVDIVEPGKDAPVELDPGRDGRAGAEPRISADRRQRMPRHLDFGNDRDVARRRISDDRAHFGLACNSRRPGAAAGRPARSPVPATPPRRSAADTS